MNKFYYLIFTLIIISCTSDNLTGSLYDISDTDNTLTFGDKFSEKYKEYDENVFVNAETEPLSTFSVDADGGSYANARRYLNLSQNPPKASVRIEEFLNYFDFNYAESTNDHPLSLNYDLAVCPWESTHALLRLGIKGKTIPQSELPNSNYVFLIDVSGSMNSPDKLGILKAGFNKFADNLESNDKVSIVTYAGSASVLLNSANGDETDLIKNAINQLGASGSTAGAEGIYTAYKIAEENFIEGGNNRIIIGSDGDFNVGPSSTDELVSLIKEKRKTGIYLTVLGVGGGNLNDYGMEQIANKGNGNYEYIDKAIQIEKVFVYDKSKFYTVAKDTKIQLNFNASVVDSYRLIGYENRALTNDEFEIDSTDAGEIGASQTITALYEIILKDGYNELNDLGTFNLKYKLPNEVTSNEISIQIESKITTPENASENFNFAASLAAFGLILKESKYKGNATKSMVIDLAENSISYDINGLKSEYLNILQTWNP